MMAAPAPYKGNLLPGSFRSGVSPFSYSLMVAAEISYPHVRLRGLASGASLVHGIGEILFSYSLMVAAEIYYPL
jgi:hypothetical protein